MSNLGPAEFLILGVVGMIVVGALVAVVVLLAVRSSRH